MRLKRIMLIAATLTILAGSLLFTTGAAHAQTLTAHTPQQTTIALDNSSYWFWGGWSGWGYCFSENQTQGIGHNSPAYRGLLYSVVGGILGPFLGAVGAFVVERNLENWLNDDRGSGDCLAFVMGQAWAPAYWGR